MASKPCRIINIVVAREATTIVNRQAHSVFARNLTKLITSIFRFRTYKKHCKIIRKHIPRKDATKSGNRLLTKSLASAEWTQSS